MPKGYEKMRDAIKEDLIKKGMSREKAVMSGLPLNQIIHGDCLEVMRQFPGIEKELKYFEIAKKRIESVTAVQMELKGV